MLHLHLGLLWLLLRCSRSIKTEEVIGSLAWSGILGRQSALALIRNKIEGRWRSAE